MTDSSAQKINASINEYLSQLSAEQIQKSDAYFEGGYFLQFFDVALTAIAAILFFKFLSIKVKKLAEHLTRFNFLQSIIYFLCFMGFNFLVFLPYTFYVSYLREHQYGLSNHTFLGWFTDTVKGFAISLILLSIFAAVLHKIIQKSSKTWWAWATAFTVVFFSFVMLIAPVYISPLFNDYKKLEDGPVKTMILDMAKSNDIPADNVYWYDASKQTKKVSANVSGALGTMRISLNDNLLLRTSPEEIKAVMAHEMGHYVLNHIYKGILEIGIVFFIIYFVLFKFLQFFFKKYKEKFSFQSEVDIHLAPIFVIAISVLFFIITPVTNSITRWAEVEADIFGLNTAQEPDGFAKVTLKLVEYRKARPSPLEEFWWYDHPSAYNRIKAAMTWKHYHQSLSEGN